MSQFIQLHLLTSYAAANLNRDDAGRPKTLMFGGSNRLRLSSQSLKRAFRTSDVFEQHVDHAIGKRSKAFADRLIALLEEQGLKKEEAIQRAEKLIVDNKLGTFNKSKGKTEQLVHLSPEELENINAEKAVLIHKPKAVDIAMFGRMLADNPGYNVEAAVQVAHAFTTHRVTVEDDYFTAVDDLKKDNEDADRGAGHIGVQQYGAGLFYLYICINASLLLDNLSQDVDLAQKALAGFITAAATVPPIGKQNSFASRAKAEYVLMEIGEETPRSLAAAFQHPIGKPSENYFEASVKALTERRNGFKAAYEETWDSHELNVHAGGKSLNDLIGSAQAVLNPGSAHG